jgi:DNA-binding response OmpR family regulator
VKKVLVIEDTDEVRELVVAALDAHGFQTCLARDGATGIELARKEPPDLILCDVRMPGVDGYGVLSALRQDAITATIPFIFLTGEVDKTHMRQGMELGADDYLTKPFTFDELLGAVNSRLKKQQEVVERSEKKLQDLRGNLSLALPHELLTPLHGILGLSTLIVEDYATMKPEEIADFARNIHDSGLRLNRLIENFLTYSRIELVMADPEKVAAMRTGESIHLKGIVAEIANRLAAKHGRASDLQLELAEAAVPVQFDNFKKIVEELADNSFKFSKPGMAVRIASVIEGQKVHLTFTDQGRGLTSEQIARVGAHMQFDRKFYEQQGSGLGLIIAKRMTELYGGFFTIESTPGERTTVKVTLPIVD